MAGIVASVNLNRGGVPKPPVDGTMVRALGLVGDGHHNLDVHGGPTAAVCLYPQEAVERVRADGHQSFPGSYGDNLTLLGIDWGALVAGLQSRGLVDGSGTGLTDEGRALKERIEATTNDLAAPAYSSLTDDEADELATLLRPLTKAVVATGEIPVKSPMGIDFSKPA